MQLNDWIFSTKHSMIAIQNYHSISGPKTHLHSHKTIPAFYHVKKR